MIKTIKIDLDNGRTINISGINLSPNVRKKLIKDIQRFISPKPVLLTEPSFEKEDS